MRRRAGALVVGALVLSWPAVAHAHEEINPARIEVSRPTFFTLTAANEEKVALVKLAVRAPEGASFGTTTRQPAGWQVDRQDQIITWSGGSVGPGQFEQWGFETDGAEHTGTLAYKITLTFGDGRTKEVESDVTALAAGSLSKPAVSGAAVAQQAKRRSTFALAVGVAALLVAIVTALGRRAPSAGPTRPDRADW